jgi:hypothetical protein
MTYINEERGFKLIIKALPNPEECIVVLELTGGYEKKVIMRIFKKKDGGNGNNVQDR